MVPYEMIEHRGNGSDGVVLRGAKKIGEKIGKGTLCLTVHGKGSDGP